MGTKLNPSKYDCYAKAKDDEPIFVLKASDPTAAAVVRYWVELNFIKNTQSKDKLNEATDCSAAMKRYRLENHMQEKS